jgi:hypothetical protein
LGLAQVEEFLHRIMTNEAYRRRFLDDPEAALEETNLDSGEQWAILEALRDDEMGRDFPILLRTRLAAVGIHITQLPPGLERIFASRGDQG